MDLGLQGKVALITGASRGLGRAIAEATLAVGHNLIATARNPATLDDLSRVEGKAELP